MFIQTVSAVLQRILCKENDRNAKKTTKRGKQHIHLVRNAATTAAIMLLIISCLLWGLRLRAFAEPNDKNYVVGVKTGDWAKYDFCYVGWSGWVDWVNVEVQNVSGTNVVIHVSAQLSESRRYENATISFNVEEGWIEEQPYSPYGVPYIIAGDLSVNDYAFTTLLEKLSTSVEPQFSRNYSLNYSTISRKYGEVVREVLLITQSYEKSFFGYMMKVYEEFCWDKATGLLLEQKTIGYVPETVTNVTEAEFMWIVDTNLWEMPQPSTSWVQTTLGTTIPVASIIVFLAIRKTTKWNKRLGK